ncbi:DUF4762 family protein [Intestinirhabdus alba]|jgi:hypothetical protein|uniref:DUF4762 domain-containing protein n=1 Tax=Intestinirhabdus alba TaxID=2899544 RepID=A0A6L6IJV7_9ENTR|nr:DUF4762 family protein [Intestinirhabdus alba]MTH47132.1 DUF4762 domain-containing protein [Intestinirhabdus alba]
MKKITAVEAAGVIGGTCRVCYTNYKTVTIGGVTACRQVTTCRDKFGKRVYIKPTAAANCGGVPNR